jgi:DNA-binding transcriptional LysR family regulator
MELRHVIYFIAVAEELHFGRASQGLHVAQPSLSQQIRRLEAELGAPLFDRTRRQISLTKQGEAFLPEAKRLVAQSRRAQEAVSLATENAIGSLIIGCVSSAFYDCLPALVRTVRHQHPDLAISVRERRSVDAIAEVAEQRLDAAVVHLAAVPLSVDHRILRTEAMAVALAVTHPLSGESTVSLDALRDDPFIMLPRYLYPELHDNVISACRHAGFSPTVSYDAQSFMSQLGLVASGFGVAFLPHSTRKFSIPGVIFRPVAPEQMISELALVWNRHRLPPALQVMWSTPVDP